MLAERKSLEIWEFGESQPIKIAMGGVGGTKQQGTQQTRHVGCWRG